MTNWEQKLDRLYPKLRIGRKCANPACNRQAAHIHHIVRRNVDLLRYDINNLLPLCEECHRQIHDEGLYNRGMDFVDEQRRNYLQRMKNIDFKQFLLELNITKDDFFAQKERELLANIGKTEFKQNTPEWLEEKNCGIGASEIAAVVKSFVPQKELMELMGENRRLISLPKTCIPPVIRCTTKSSAAAVSHPCPTNCPFTDTPWKNILTGKCATIRILPVREPRILSKGRTFPRMPFAPRTVMPKACTTALLTSTAKPIRQNALFGKKKPSTRSKAARENIFYNGLPWQYIFQNQYQMLLCGCEAGIISSMVLEPDTPFNRGRIVALIEQRQFEEIDRLFEIRVDNFIYGKIPEIQATILSALRHFETAVAENRTPDNVMIMSLDIERILQRL